MIYNFSPNFTELELQWEEIYRNLGYGGALPDRETELTLKSILAHAQQICKPKAQYSIFPLALQGTKLIIAEVEMNTGKIIANYLSNSTKIAVFVATAGVEYDTYLHDIKASGDIYMEFLADAIGSEIAEATVRFVSAEVGRIAAEMNMHITLSYSPGYCGWHVREQPKLFSLLCAQNCGISLNDSCLMHPIKSVSGIIGLSTESDVKVPYSCDICGLKTCYKRKE